MNFPLIHSYPLSSSKLRIHSFSIQKQLDLCISIQKQNINSIVKIPFSKKKRIVIIRMRLKFYKCKNKTRKIIQMEPSHFQIYQWDRRTERNVLNSKIFFFYILLPIYSDLVAGNSHTKRSCFIRNSFKIQIELRLHRNSTIQNGKQAINSVNTNSDRKFNWNEMIFT